MIQPLMIQDHYCLCRSTGFYGFTPIDSLRYKELLHVHTRYSSNTITVLI